MFVHLSNPNDTLQPKKSINKVVLKRDFRRVAKAIENSTAGNYYRPDLKAACLAKWSLISAAQKRAAKGK